MLTSFKVLAAAVLVGLSAPFTGAAAVPPPAIIATLDLSKTFENLDEKKVKQTELENFGKGLQAELDKLVDAVKQEGEKIKLLPDGQAKKDAVGKALEMQVQARVKKELYEAMIDNKRAELFKGIFEKIEKASERMAQQNGYTMVISSDVGITIPDNPPPSANDVQRTISLKRFLYIAPAHDATDDLVKLMNNEYKAGDAAKPAGK